MFRSINASFFFFTPILNLFLSKESLVYSIKFFRVDQLNWLVFASEISTLTIRMLMHPKF